jgi:hypothetical protein
MFMKCKPLSFFWIKYTNTCRFPIVQPWYRYSVVPDNDLSLWEKIDKRLVLMWRKSLRYEQFGLLYDDIIGDEVPLVNEALNRLPKAVKEARDRRITRVCLCF